MSNECIGDKHGMQLEPTSSPAPPQEPQKHPPKKQKENGVQTQQWFLLRISNGDVVVARLAISDLSNPDSVERSSGRFSGTVTTVYFRAPETPETVYP
eukprot:6189706-Amphidinium_carterae.1